MNLLLTAQPSPGTFTLPPSASPPPAVKISGIDLKTITGRDVILVEDIIDTGTTMSALVPLLAEYAPASVRVASLLEKRTAKSCGFKADYVGFSIPDAFVSGARERQGPEWFHVLNGCVPAVALERFIVTATAFPAPVFICPAAGRGLQHGLQR